MPALFIGGSPEFIQECKTAAAAAGVQVVGEAASPYDLYILVDRAKPDGVLVPSHPEWVSAAVDLARLRPNLLVHVSGPVTANTWARMAEARVFTVPADPQRAVAACAAALGRLPSQRFSFEENGEALAGVSFKEKGAVAIPARMLMLYSAKGGVGKTTIAESLAAVLGLWGKAQENATGVPCRTALLDFNLDGSTGVYLWCPRGLPKTAFLWEDFLSGVPRWADVAGMMNYHEGTGVYYLAPPLMPDEKVRFRRDLAEAIISTCRKFFHFVVVDSGVAIKDRDATAVCLTTATDILLVADFKYRTLRLLADAYRRELRHVIDETKTSMVLNRVKRTWFSTQDFIAAFAREAGTAIPLKGELPEEPGLERKEGEMGKIPFVCAVPDAPFSRAVYALARNILGVDVSLIGSKSAGGRSFSRLLSLFGRKRVNG